MLMSFHAKKLTLPCLVLLKESAYQCAARLIFNHLLMLPIFRAFAKIHKAFLVLQADQTELEMTIFLVKKGRLGKQYERPAIY